MDRRSFVQRFVHRMMAGLAAVLVPFGRGKTPKREIGICDLVTRDGSDVYAVVDMNASGDLILVRCIIPPDGSWIAVGETEWNTVWRYDLLEDLLPLTPDP